MSESKYTNRVINGWILKRMLMTRLGLRLGVF